MYNTLCALTNDIRQTRNITYASVHDSYWTHAATVDQMNEIIRDTFIALHESDVLAKLDREVLTPSHILTSHPCSLQTRSSVNDIATTRYRFLLSVVRNPWLNSSVSNYSSTRLFRPQTVNRTWARRHLSWFANDASVRRRHSKSMGRRARSWME